MKERDISKGFGETVLYEAQVLHKCQQGRDGEVGRGKEGWAQKLASYCFCFSQREDGSYSIVGFNSVLSMTFSVQGSATSGYAEAKTSATEHYSQIISKGKYTKDLESSPNPATSM